MADEKYFYHYQNSFKNEILLRVLPPILRTSALPLTSTEMVKYGKMLQSVDVKSSKQVVK
ncbi:hypothetical protein F160043M1_19300 [Anaerostipes hadrus]